MAQYKHLPIYRKSLELAIFLENCVKGFPRYHKYALGADLRSCARELVTLVMRAISSKDRAAIRWACRAAQFPGWQRDWPVSPTSW